MQKKEYLEDIDQKRESLVKRFEKTPTSIGNKHKRWRMAADIEQMKWRTTYLKEDTI